MLDLEFEHPDMYYFELCDQIDRHKNKKHTAQLPLFQQEVEIEAYHLNEQDFKGLQQLAQKVSETSDEGHKYDYFFASNRKELRQVPAACCRSQYSVKNTIEGNKMSSDGDTYATESGHKSENLYVFWLVDKQKYAFIREKYWCY